MKDDCSAGWVKFNVHTNPLQMARLYRRKRLDPSAKPFSIVTNWLNIYCTKMAAVYFSFGDCNTTR